MAAWIKIIIDFLTKLFGTVENKQEFRALTYEDRKDLYHAKDAVNILEAKQDSVREAANLEIQIVKQEQRVKRKIKKITDEKGINRKGHKHRNRADDND